VQTDPSPDAGRKTTTKTTSTRAERVIMLTYGLTALLLLVCAIAVWAFSSFYGPRASFLYSITLAQWLFWVLFCAVIFATLWPMLTIFTKDRRVAADIIALLISLTPILFNASVDFRLIYSGEYEGEAKVEYLLWRLNKSNNPTETNEYRQLESMLSTLTDEEGRTSIQIILNRLESRNKQ
jgi:hypothetical protein